MKLPIPFSTWKTRLVHSGIDFPKTSGTPFHASGPGKVLRLSHSAKGGYWIVVQYDVGVTVGYAHMNSHKDCPKPGTRVKLGTFLGYVGFAGNVRPAGKQGAHIHLEIIGVGTQSAVWKWFDKKRAVVAGRPVAPKPSTGGAPSAPAPTNTAPQEEDDMPIIIVQRKNANLAKGQMTHNRRMREITKYENVAYRAAAAQAPDSVIYVTVSDSDYANLLAGKD